MRVVKNLLLILIGVLISTLLIEVYLRIRYENSPADIGYPRWYFISTDYGFDINPNFIPHVEHNFVEHRYKIWSNSIGCFDKQANIDNPKILIVGDSFAWGYTEFRYKWGTVLEDMLDMRVLKCGVSGFGTKQSYIKASKLIKLFPSVDVIVYSYFPNDFDDDYMYPHFEVVGGYRVNSKIIGDFDKGSIESAKVKSLTDAVSFYLDYGVPYKPKGDIAKIIYKLNNWLKEHIYTYGFLYTFLKHNVNKNDTHTFDRAYPLLVFGMHKYKWIAPEFQKHLKNILRFKELDRKFIVSLIPIRDQVYPELKFCKSYFNKIKLYRYMYSLCKNEECYLRPQRLLRKFLEKEKVAYIDYLPLFRFYANHDNTCFLDPKTDLYWRIDWHWNKKGNILAGLLLSYFLLKEGFINVNKSDLVIKKIKNALIREFGKFPPEHIWKEAVYIPTN